MLWPPQHLTHQPQAFSASFPWRLRGVGSGCLCTPQFQGPGLTLLDLGRRGCQGWAGVPWPWPSADLSHQLEGLADAIQRLPVLPFPQSWEPVYSEELDPWGLLDLRRLSLGPQPLPGARPPSPGGSAKQVGRGCLLGAPRVRDRAPPHGVVGRKPWCSPGWLGSRTGIRGRAAGRAGGPRPPRLPARGSLVLAPRSPDCPQGRSRCRWGCGRALLSYSRSGSHSSSCARPCRQPAFCSALLADGAGGLGSFPCRGF